MSLSAGERQRERCLTSEAGTVAELVHDDTVTEPGLNWYTDMLGYM